MTSVAFSPYIVYGREEWARLRADTPMTLTESELENLSGLTERVSTRKWSRSICRSRGCSISMSRPRKGCMAQRPRFLRKGDGKMPFIIGLAGSVAVGKSTTARVLQALLARWPSHPSVDLVPTDGFLYPTPFLKSAG